MITPPADPPITRDMLIREVSELDGVLSALADLQSQILDKMTAARLRLQLINKKLQAGGGGQ